MTNTTIPISENAVPSIVFFGSFQDQSAKVLEALAHAHSEKKIDLKAVVTTPPMPAGRKQELKKTPVHELALSAKFPVFTPVSLNDQNDPHSLSHIPECDYFITAGYGKLLPVSWLKFPNLTALNIHFSLLPSYRGANPAEWALLAQEQESGISVIEMSPEFDTGAVLAQVSTKLGGQDSRETVYEQLYDLAAQHCAEIIQTDFDWRRSSHDLLSTSTEEKTTGSSVNYFFPPVVQTSSPTPYARKLGKEDAWISAKILGMACDFLEQNSDAHTPIDLSDMSPFLWEQWNLAQKSGSSSLAAFVERAIRALTGFPCLWTQVETVKGLKRLKVFSGKLIADTELSQKQQPQISSEPKKFLQLNLVQIEGQQQLGWNQIKNTVIWEKTH